jgi:hypothetical protein
MGTSVELKPAEISQPPDCAVTSIYKVGALVAAPRIGISSRPNRRLVTLPGLVLPRTQPPLHEKLTAGQRRCGGTVPSRWNCAKRRLNRRPIRRGRQPRIPWVFKINVRLSCANGQCPAAIPYRAVNVRVGQWRNEN